MVKEKVPDVGKVSFPWELKRKTEGTNVRKRWSEHGGHMNKQRPKKHESGNGRRKPPKRGIFRLNSLFLPQVEISPRVRNERQDATDLAMDLRCRCCMVTSPLKPSLGEE